MIQVDTLLLHILLQILDTDTDTQKRPDIQDTYQPYEA